MCHGLAHADRQFSTRLAAAKQQLLQNPAAASADIYLAAACGDAQRVQQFLAADPKAVHRPGGPRDWPPLLYLCFSRLWRDPDRQQSVAGLLATARILLQAGADPNAYFMLGDERETALYAACGVANQADLAELLLQHGADVNDEDATYHVAEFPEHDCIRVLFEHGLDADRAATVLLRKLDFNDYQGVQLILDLGCDVNHPGNWGKTPLHQAIMRGRDLATIELLISRGADVLARRNDGATPTMLASLYGRPQVVDLLQRSGAGPTPGAVDQFMAACGQGDDDRASELLREQPGLYEQLSENQKAWIVVAGRVGNLPALRTMLGHGFDIAARDEQGFTALHWAAWYGHLECVRFLIERKAPLHATNRYGGTVIDATVWGYANSDGNDRNCRQILSLLAAAGGDPETVSPFPSGHSVADQVIGELRGQAGDQHGS